MGKAEKKGADQQQQQHNNNTKLGLGPLLSKPTGKASKPQLTTPPGKGASTSLAALKQMIDSQLRELNSKLDQDAGKMQRQFASISTALEKTAQGHSAQANKVRSRPAAPRPRKRHPQAAASKLCHDSSSAHKTSTCVLLLPPSLCLQYFQDTATFMEQAKASHDQAVSKLTKISKDANTQLNRSAVAPAPTSHTRTQQPQRSA